jgi:diacylglycerol kinase (ATP)
MAKPGNTGLMRIFRAFGFSMQGFAALWKNEAAFRQELMLAVVMVPAAVWVARNALELSLLLLPLFIVVITEIVNSAVEAVVDRISDEHHELAGRAKDMGSAAVFVALTMTAVIWGIVLYDIFLAG